MTGSAPCSITRSTNVCPAYPRSAITRSNVKPSNKAGACGLSWHCPAVSRRRSGLPKPSTRTWILVLKPPRLRPSACSSAVPFFQHRQHRDGRGQWYCPQSHVPCLGHQQNALTSAPTRPDRTTARTAYRCYSSCHTQAVVSATAPHCGRSRARLRQTGGTPAHRSQGTYAGRAAKTRVVSSIVRQSVVRVSYENRTTRCSNVNRT